MKIMFIIWVIALYAIVLTGCAGAGAGADTSTSVSTSTSPIRSTDNLITKVTQVTLTFTDQITMNEIMGSGLIEGFDARAVSLSNGNVCHIVLLYDDYPGCLLHEIIHCFEGDWHKDDTDNSIGNDQYCTPAEE